MRRAFLAMMFMLSNSVHASPIADLITSGVFVAAGVFSSSQQKHYSSKANDAKNTNSREGDLATNYALSASYFWGAADQELIMHGATLNYSLLISRGNTYGQLANAAINNANSSYNSYESSLKKENSYKGMATAAYVGCGIFLVKSAIGFISTGHQKSSGEKTWKESNLNLIPTNDYKGAQLLYSLRWKQRNG